MSNQFDGSVEWYTFTNPYGENEDGCMCARCGGSCDFARGVGNFGHKGVRSGTWHCISDPGWCNDHPLPGREHIESSALSWETWDEVM